MPLIESNNTYETDSDWLLDIEPIKRVLMADEKSLEALRIRRKKNPELYNSEAKHLVSNDYIHFQEL